MGVSCCKEVCTDKGETPDANTVSSPQPLEYEDEEPEDIQFSKTGEPIVRRRKGRLKPPVEPEDADQIPDCLHVYCPEKHGLEDIYELTSMTCNKRPVWCDGQNHIYCTRALSWAVAIDGESISQDKGWLYDTLGGGDEKLPHAVRSWKVYDGKVWSQSSARISVVPPPYLNVECKDYPAVDGCYLLTNLADILVNPEHSPVWGNGAKRLYLNEHSIWVLAMQEESPAEGAGIVRSDPRLVETRPDFVARWQLFVNGTWKRCKMMTTPCSRPPPYRLQVRCTGKPELNGIYRLQEEMLNGRNVWADGDNNIYQTTGEAWAVCMGRDSADNDRGWLYAKYKEAKYPDKVEEWHLYDGITWSRCEDASVTVPPNDMQNPPAAPVFVVGQTIKMTGNDEEDRNACEGCSASCVCTSGRSKFFSDAPTSEAQLITADAPPGRLVAQAEEDIGILPHTAWHEIKPHRSFLDELRKNKVVAARIPKHLEMADDVEAKVMELKYRRLPVKLRDDYLAAIVAYTHDLHSTRQGNFYYEVNAALRKRGPESRRQLMQDWGNLLHYLIMALAELPDFQGHCYRGYPDKKTVLEEYDLGRPIQWGAFTSATTSFEAARQFLDPNNGIIFKIAVTSGRKIDQYSFFPREDEVLLTPSHWFTVASNPYQKRGYAMIDLVQQKKRAVYLS